MNSHYLAQTISETSLPNNQQQDPLIAKNLQREQYIGIFSLAIALIAAVGIISRRVEYAILFAIALSLVLIAFFLFI
ncbi:MAG: hypothetical protein KME28_27965 [Pelatocladus maniniholoensis HA4357-MV3]|jgi:hypothetical protein|uniref:Uncharacterized protein n=1 Tax=Pelatocladus maniniholoensis HA4357-MV3 TaxID=1117104 RepID=A0A9E3HDA3_9NOST|nr:hypothetical protein [Pelatocladus maniniholoensis HA4357-MV3]BAZ67330.1 hypothetical protein NIES4106_20850 [Fischerella sp. NIES-4106]